MSAGERGPGERGDEREALRWPPRVSLTPRILAVNIIALAMLAGGFFYLDSYRSRLIDNRVAQVTREARLMAEALDTVHPAQRDALIRRLARDTHSRVRLYTKEDRLYADSAALGVATFRLDDPEERTWSARTARFLDALIDTVVIATRPPPYPADATPPDVRVARTAGIAAGLWRAPDRSPVITAAARLPSGGVVLAAVNGRDITRTVRAERYRLSLVLLIVIAASILLSLYLARTIVVPLRRLARAAVRVRRGRAREVVVPRLPTRRDEIGMLARALSDMSLALRARIDATEAFAADLAHELKNPLASLRSAVDTLTSVRDPDLQARLLGIVRDDVLRLDRLITDISEVSRLDAQLSRAKFETVDLAALLAALITQRLERGTPRGVALHLDLADTPLPVLGEGVRLERVFDNLIDNAISFSPKAGTVALTARRNDDQVAITIDDDGPGVPEDARARVFERFHSHRPPGEPFGTHSGLGLAIARTIVEAHGGTIRIEPREDHSSGARFVVRLPLADPA